MRDILIHTVSHQLTAFQVLGVLLDAMRQDRHVRCWLIVPRGEEEDWIKRIRVVLAKQRRKTSNEVKAGLRDQKSAMFSRLFMLNFSAESATVGKNTAILVTYHETAAHKRGKHMIQYLAKQGIV